MNARGNLVILFSVLVAVDVAAAGAALGDAIGVKTVSLIVLASKAIQAGATYYVNNATVSKARVVAARRDDGEVVAGPAAELKTGSVVEDTGQLRAAPGEHRAEGYPG